MFNDNIVQLRKLHGMTQEDLANRIFVSSKAVSKWETGNGFPNLHAHAGFRSIPGSGFCFEPLPV